jgi:hypothetical protein
MSNNTTSGFSLNTLQMINSAFNADYNNSSVTVGNVSIPLVSFLANPNYSGGGGSNPEVLNSIYNGITNQLKNFITKVTNNTVEGYNLGNVKNFRITVSGADGHIFFDSFKGNNNTYDNFLNKSINENHGTRNYIQQAIHSKNGVGYELKWSSTTQGIETYYAVRLGMSETMCICVVTFSYSNSY